MLVEQVDIKQAPMEAMEVAPRPMSAMHKTHATEDTKDRRRVVVRTETQGHVQAGM